MKPPTLTIKGDNMTRYAIINDWTNENELRVFFDSFSDAQAALINRWINLNLNPEDYTITEVAT
jgi:hypothetical protein